MLYAPASLQVIDKDRKLALCTWFSYDEDKHKCFVISHVSLSSFSLGRSLDMDLIFDIPLNMHLMPESICVHWFWCIPPLIFTLLSYVCSSSLPSLHSLSLYLDFALTKVICSSGNGSIMSSNLLAKCLPCILSAIQSSLGLASAYCRVKFHISTVLRGLLRKRNAKSWQV